jgi:tetratricopeptide (TPR) repeat protein
MTIRRLIPGVLAAAALFAQTRFDYVVREDFFAGLAGNKAALDRGMATAEKILAGNPKHAEALVWHGQGLATRSIEYFQKGDQQTGMRLFQQAVDEMQRAVDLEPNNLGVRIPRGAVLREMSRNTPANIGAPLLEAARTDLQFAYDSQKEQLDTVGKPHPLGELLQGLGDIYSRQGNAEEAAKFYGMIPERLPNTEYAKRAAQWLQTRQPLPAAQSACVGCHTGR